MRLPDLALRHRTTVVVLTLLLVVGGLLSYLTIPKEASPSIELATIVVTTLYPGASPRAVESNITEPIEHEIATINGIEELRSTSSKGVSTIVVEFTPDVDVDNAYQQVSQAVDRAESEIPAIVEDSLINEISFEDFPILTINLAAQYSLARLKQVAENLQQEIEGIPGILDAALAGGLEREVQVRVNLTALKGHDLAFDDLIETIREENRNVPGGDIEVDRQSYLVRVQGELENPARQIEDLVITSTEDGRNVYVRDVADVIFGFKERQSYARLGVLKTENAEGEAVAVASSGGLLPVVSLSVTKESGASILEAVNEVKAVIDSFDFPAGTQVTITGDQSTFVEDLLTEIENSVVSGLLFVVLVLLFFLGVRNALLTGIAIPISMCVAFIFFNLGGYTINFIILFSFIIALGLLVDSAIVIVENIVRWRESGCGRVEAARRGAGELGGAVVASVAVTLAAFGPMLFWPGIVGEFMGYLPLTLIIALTSALLVALIINPVIASYFVRTQQEEQWEHPAFAGRSRAARWMAALAILLSGLVLGFANWKTLIVLLVAILLVYVLYRRVLRPAAMRFRAHGLPKLRERYRVLVTRMLERDYTPRHALLRNAGALSALTLGIGLCAIGGAIFATIGLTASLVLLAPGALLLVLGLFGVLLHVVESAWLGGAATARIAGLLFCAMLLILGISLANGALSVGTFFGLLAAPALFVLIGLAGAVFNRRERLILTDNRARLITGAVGGLVILAGLYLYAPTGQSFFPNTDPRLIRIDFEASTGTTLEAANRLANTVQARLQAFLADHAASRAGIKNVLVSVGSGGGAFPGGGGAAAANEASITLTMVDFAEREESSTRTLEKLRGEFRGIPGIDLRFDEQGSGGPPTGPPVNVEISGPDFERVAGIAREVTAKLEKAIESGRLPGLVDVESSLDPGRPVVSVDVDRVRAAQFGLSTGEIAETVRTAIQGTRADIYRSGDDEYDITVRLRPADRESLESLESLVVTTDEAQVPLTAVADLRVGTGFSSITRIDQEPVATVSADAAPGYNGPEVLARVQDLLAQYRADLPPGYAFAYTGGNEEMQESFSFLFTALLVGLALIFIIMVAQFNSVLAPLIIMIAVILSLIGVFLGLILTRTPFNLFTFLGIISLAGIMANNNIVLIEYMLQLQAGGKERREAIIEAGATRLRPVLLAALSATIGLVPLTIGLNIDFVGLLTDFDPDLHLGSANTQFWRPMGIAIISGLLFGTFITLVIIPSVCSVFDSLRRRLASAFGR